MRYLLVPHPKLGLPCPVESARPEDVVGEVELDNEELRTWQELVARATIQEGRQSGSSSCR